MMENRFFSKKIHILIIYIFILSLLLLFFEKSQILFFLNRNIEISIYNISGVITEKYLIGAYTVGIVFLFAAGNLCCIRCYSLLDDLLKKQISHIIFCVIFLFFWIFARNYVNHMTLLLIGSSLLLRWFYIAGKRNQIKAHGLIAVLMAACFLTVLTSLSPKQYTGEFIYHFAEQENVEEIFFNYRAGDDYKRAGTAGESQRIVFDIEDDFLSSDESVFSIFLKAPLLKSEQLQIIGFNLYNGDILVDSISGAALMHSHNGMLNLDNEISKRGSVLLEWGDDTYGQIYFNHALSAWIEHSIHMDFTGLLQTISFLIAIFISKMALDYLSDRQKLKRLVNNKKHFIILYCGLLLIASIGEVLSIEAISGSLDSINPVALIVNILLMFSINLILFSITNIQVAVVSTGIILGMIGIANYYTLMYRGTPVLPWDVYAINTAANVIGNYHIYITWEILWTMLISVLSVLTCFRVYKNIEKNISKRHWKERGITLVIGILFAGCLINPANIGKMGIRENVYEQKNNYMENGWCLASAMNLKYIHVERPQNFSEEKIQEILEKYKTNDENAVEDTPNIVIILNESFANLEALNSLETNMEVTPFKNSLTGRNVVKGTCYVSQVGGGTCNSEYELLMGSTMAFFPNGSIVFQQHMNSEQYSLIHILNNSGYQTIGMHPMQGSNWNRTKAYPLLQFQNILFYDDLMEKEFIRGYTSDRYCYQWIIDQFENKSQDDKLAIYNLTVQNHGGYEAEDYTGDIEIKNQENDAWNQYLSLVHESDAALKELFDYFSGIDDKVIVLFMGDHQPALPALESNSGTNNTLNVDKYSVPFLLWNNYDEPMEIPETLSINYLATYLLKNCKIQRSPFYLFQEEMSKEIPVIIGAGYEKDHMFYQWGKSDYNEWVENYKILQYGLNSTEVLHKDEYYE